MRISRVAIRNFRNFGNLEVETGSHLVIVGENKVGKSNFIHALRLIFDPTLPDSARRLRREDFWDGAKPLTKESEITISVDLAEFQNTPKLLGVLCDYAVEPSPMVARLTYSFFPRSDLDGDPSKDSDYDFAVYGGDRPENLISSDVRRRLPLDVLPALRDAESDLLNWRRSPLRPLLDAVSSELDEDTKKALADAISDAVDAIAQTNEVNQLATQIKTMLISMVGKHHAVDTSLSFSPTDAERVIRTLRLFVDDGLRSLSEASLGTSNLIYLALKLLSLELEVKEKMRDHSFLAIEEPEAHLHPHVQRRVFRAFLRTRKHLPQSHQKAAPTRTILLTTHSPYIASVCPVDSLVMLSLDSETSSTTAHSMIGAGLSATEKADVERYLDVTRGEMLFSRGVILVEGDAEAYLVPVFAKLMGYDFDDLGISVCSVGGTNFKPFVKLLGESGFGIPFCIITDEDPTAKSTFLATKRVRKLLAALGVDDEYDDDELFASAEQFGIFVTEHTLEIAMYKCGRHKMMGDALKELSTNIKLKERAVAVAAGEPSVDSDKLLADIESIGKGRFAQRVSSKLASGRDHKPCPKSVHGAIRYLVKRLG